MKRSNTWNKRRDKSRKIFFLFIICVIFVVYGGILLYYNEMNKSLDDFNNYLSDPSQEELILNESIANTIDNIITYTSFFLISVILVFASLIIYIMIDRGKHSKKLYNLAHYNYLTGAPNLLTFQEDVERLMKKYPEKTYAMVRFNIDRLSLLNEIYSYKIGDMILRCVTKALKKMTDEESETYGNAYGDRFFMFLECSSFDELAERRAAFEEYFYACICKVIPYRIRFPSGWYILEKGETNISSVIGKVNFAHLIARQTKLANNEIQCYDEKMKKDAIFENEIEDKMYNDLENHQFKVFYQPKFYPESGELAGAEALVKWNLDGNEIPPSMFISIFEKNGFIIKLDMYVYEEVCIFLKNLRTMKNKDIKISVNFSRFHLGPGDFVSKLCNIADKHGVPYNLLEAEITESVILEDHNALVNVIDELHEHGFTLAIDDFGSGYSSLGMLKDTFVDVIKLDRSFFENSKDQDRAWQIFSSAVYIAKNLNIKVVAEGVETEDHLNKLKKIGCDMVQGFYYSHPITADEFLDKYL